METFWQDIRFGLRLLGKAPGFTSVAVLTLALGIGANTAIFSAIDAVLLRPLPFPHPNQLLALWNGRGWPLSGPDFLDWQRQNKSFSGMALYTFNQSYNLTGAGRPSYVNGVETEANFFSVLGVQPLLGRTWAKGEDEPGANREVVLSYGLWRGVFAGDPKIVGRTIELNDLDYTVVGVMSPEFNFPVRAGLWTPLDISPKALGARGEHQYLAIGRMKPGVTLHEAQADLSLIARRLEKLYPSTNTKVGAKVFDLHNQLIAGTGSELWFLLWSVGLVLLIACANVANLLLARSASRQKEIAVRAALGASRGRLMLQLLSESVLLALLGGVVGLFFGWAGVRLLPLLHGAVPPGMGSIRLNGSVLGLACLLALATGVIFGIAPAWQLSRTALLDVLRGGSGAAVSAGRHRRLVGNALVTAEVAVSLILLVGAGLLLKSFVVLRSTNFGVRRSGVLTARLNLPQSKYGSDAKILAFTRELLARVRSLPGVTSAAITDHLPLYGGTNGTITLYGHPSNIDNASTWVEMHGITPGYFKTFAIPLFAGRELDQEDTDRALALDTALSAHSTPAMLRKGIYPVDVNRAMVRMFWPHENPLGQRFSYNGSGGPWMQVVGVVGNTRQWGLRVPPRPEEFQPFDGETFGRTILVLHSAVPPQTMVAAVRRQVAALDPDLPLFGIRSMNQLVARQTMGARTEGLLVGLFAAVAVLLAAVGIYGVLSQLAAQRRREIGIRMALGAQRSDVLRLVLEEGLRLALLGVAIGVGAALGLSRLIRSLLYGVSATDPWTFAGVAVLLTVVALVACYFPARRAMRIEPMLALREE